MKTIFLICALFTAVAVSAQNPVEINSGRKNNSYFPDLRLDNSPSNAAIDMGIAQMNDSQPLESVPLKGTGFDVIILPSGYTIVGVINANNIRNFEMIK